MHKEKANEIVCSKELIPIRGNTRELLVGKLGFTGDLSLIYKADLALFLRIPSQKCGDEDKIIAFTNQM